jgi:hypothetical protein
MYRSIVVTAIFDLAFWRFRSTGRQSSHSTPRVCFIIWLDQTRQRQPSISYGAEVAPHDRALMGRPRLSRTQDARISLRNKRQKTCVVLLGHVNRVSCTVSARPQAPLAKGGGRVQVIALCVWGPR